MPSTYAFSKPTYGVNIDANPFGVTFYVSNTTNPTEDQGSPGPTAQGRTPKNPFTTIAAAITEAVAGRGDTIVIQRGTYTETLTVNKADLTLRSAMTHGYPDHVVITGATTVTAASVTFQGIEFFSNSASLASVTVGSTTAEVNAATFERCSFASDGTTEPRAGLRILGGNNHAVLGCRFVDNTRALLLHSGVDSMISGVRVEDNEFLENTTVDLGTAAFSGTDAFGANGGVRNLVCVRNVFGRGEVTPTDYVNISGASSGIMAFNLFANATNASADIVIPAGILYSANATEAGWSTARPS